MLSSQVDTANTIFNAVFFVVVVSAILQGTTLERVAARLGLLSAAPPRLEAPIEVGESSPLDLLDFVVAPDHAIAGAAVREVGLPRSAIIAVVDVDIETGFIKIIRYCTVHDCGNMINPQIVDTQQQGSIVQGIGAALYEELRYDKEGQLLTSTLMDYRLPSVEEVPDFELEHIVTPNPFTPMGDKGAGETGMLGPPPALCNAVEDALSPFGVKIRQTPLTPERILDLIEKAKVSKSTHG